MPDLQVTKLNNLRRYPYYTKGRYYNHLYELKTEQPRLDTMICLLRSFIGEVQMFLHSLWRGDERLPKDRDFWQVAPQLTPTAPTDLQVTWIGHSTFLIQLAGKNILTDPIFGNATVLFPRILPPGISLADLPPIDYVIISHNHLDHMDYRALLALQQRAPALQLLVPRGDQRHLLKWGFRPEQVIEGYWWEQYKLGDLQFSFLPAYHWSQRRLFDKNKSLWGSWLIESANRRLYFAGDTAYAGHFKTIAEEFGPIDLAFLPIAPCEPRKYLYTAHINAAEAGQAFLDLGAQLLVPMHWGTFHFGSDAFDTPIRQIKRWWSKTLPQDLALSRLQIMRFGETRDFGGVLDQRAPAPLPTHYPTPDL